MASKVKFGIVGCGRIAQRHAEHISAKGELTGVCDVVKAKADEMAARYGAASYYSVEEMLASGHGMDVVAIYSPNGLHAQHSMVGVY